MVLNGIRSSPDKWAHPDIVKRMSKCNRENSQFTYACQSRKFSDLQSASSEIVETLITSDVGLKSALNSLTRKEVLMLHFLLALNEPVDISAFARISNQDGYTYGTCYRLVRRKGAPSGDTLEKHYVTDSDKACIDFAKIPLTVLNVNQRKSLVAIGKNT
jgi:hypothetical protein